VGADEADLTLLKSKLGVRLEDALLEAALTHPSYAHENPTRCPLGHNGRLEFLGDAVLEFCISQLLYRLHPGAGEGELTRLRAAVVSEDGLWRAAQGLGLGSHLRLGRGEDASGGRERPSLLADSFEAVVGAVYLSSGIRAAQRFILRHLGPLVRDAAGRPLLDAKTALQETAQAVGESVDYVLVSVTGPDHLRVFEVEVKVGGKSAGYGRGKTKKEAEQAAAREALRSRSRRS